MSLISSLTYSRKKELLFWLSRGLNLLTCVTRQIRGGGGGDYMRPGRTQTGMSSYQSPYISFDAFTWDQPQNELRPV